jgi:hypothetical protein
MWLFLLSSLVVGVALARLKVWALIPVILIFSMIVVTSGFLSGLKWGTIALTVVANLVPHYCSSPILLAQVFLQARDCEES